MSDQVSTAGPDLFFVVAAGLLGAVLSLVAELLIARFLPRLGELPSTGTRIATAAVTASLCAGLALRTGLEPPLPAFLLLVVLSVQLARIDIVHHLLPNPLVLALLIAGMVLLTVSSSVSANWTLLVRAAAGAIALFLVYLILALISPGGIGMGDVKLAAPVGLYLGYLGWPQLFYGGALGFVVGGVSAAALVVAKGVRRPAEVAFGPSMLAAALATIFYSV